MGKKPETNPYGANQYKADPRQAKFLVGYLDPNSETFSNAYQSALEAGYTEEYASNIVSRDLTWLSDNVREADLVGQAMENLKTLLKSADERITLDTSKYVTERLYKKKFSRKEEVDHTSKGKSIVPTQLNKEDQEAIDKFHKDLIDNRNKRAKE